MKERKKAVSRAKSVTITVSDVLWNDLKAVQDDFAKRMRHLLPMATIASALMERGLEEHKKGMAD